MHRSQVQAAQASWSRRVFKATIETFTGRHVTVGPTNERDTAAALAQAALVAMQGQLGRDEDRVLGVTITPTQSQPDLKAFARDSARVVAVVMHVLGKYDEHIPDNVSAHLGSDLLEGLTDPTDQSGRDAKAAFVELWEFRKTAHAIAAKRLGEAKAQGLSDVQLLAWFDEQLPIKKE